MSSHRRGKGRPKTSLKAAIETARQEVANSPSWLKQIYARNDAIARSLTDRTSAARSFTELRVVLDEVFNAAADERPARQDQVRDPHDGYMVPAWVLYERDQMFDVVTRERAKLGKGPVPLERVVRAEMSAKGHVDYQRKFVLGCAELVIEP